MKAAAMARLWGRPPFRVPPRFSKYSGIQEFRNLVALFVNVVGKNGDRYQNEFLDIPGGTAEGARVTWFGQRHHTPEHPTIRKMVGDGPAAVPVVLCIRAEGCPYVYCGRVRAAAVDAAHRPLKVVWRLEDAAALRRSPAFLELAAPS